MAAPLPMDSADELSEKIRLEAMDIKNKMGLNQDTLKLLRQGLKIFPLPLEQCKSVSFNQGDCYSKLLNGLKTMHSLLSSTRLYNKFSLTDLLYDLQEFISNLEEEMNVQGIPIDPHSPQELPNGISPFQEEAGVFLILHDLCNAMSTLQKALAS
ncbi:myelomonocytic growth factor-like [Mixophyes fleayi]|uniref:myelomonocytic growth factor-like n=1 Tax=Mixophyes fleayi TaxID=3061075 RepID=UPI003F4DF927